MPIGHISRDIGRVEVLGRSPLRRVAPLDVGLTGAEVTPRTSIGVVHAALRLKNTMTTMRAHGRYEHGEKGGSKTETQKKGEKAWSVWCCRLGSVPQWLCVTGPGAAGTPCGGQGWAGTGGEAKLCAAHLRARHTPTWLLGNGRRAGSFLLLFTLLVVTQRPWGQSICADTPPVGCPAMRAVNFASLAGSCRDGITREGATSGPLSGTGFGSRPALPSVY